MSKNIEKVWQNGPNMIEQLASNRWKIIETSKQIQNLRILELCKESFVETKFSSSRRSKPFIKNRSQKKANSMLEKTSPKWCNKQQKWCNTGSKMKPKSISNQFKIDVEKRTSKNLYKSTLGSPKAKKIRKAIARVVDLGEGRDPKKGKGEGKRY